MSSNSEYTKCSLLDGGGVRYKRLNKLKTH